MMLNSLFSNLSSLNIFELNDLRKKYEILIIHLQK